MKQFQNIIVCWVLSILCISCTQAQTVSPRPSGSNLVTDYASCVKAGYPTVRTYPGRCVAPGGFIFVEPTAPLGKPNQAQLCKNMCGDGVCQEIVCMGSNCPCAESHQKCPQDCR